MIYVGVPFGSAFGWGVLGKEITLALADLTDIRVLIPPEVDQRISDEVELYRIRKLLVGVEQHGQQVGDSWRLNGPVIQAAASISQGLLPFVPHIAPPAHVGYAVFEDNRLSPSVVANMRRHYRHVAAGSTYCADVLREYGFTDVSVIPHGVDSTLFSPRQESRKVFKDRFVIFSGGKFELRKGQDVVIRAYKVLQDRHPDVMLINSWHNGWPKNRDTMAESDLIRYFPPVDNNHVMWMNALLAANGIDVDRVITVGQRDQRLLPSLYHVTDLGVFPNRVEGGNNMVLMEFMACGKPALVSFNSGHRDIVRRQNAVLIERHRPMERRSGSDVTAVWNDPSVEETINKLEWCYQHRDQLHTLGDQAAVDMRGFSWKRLAEGLLQAVRAVDTIA